MLLTDIIRAANAAYDPSEDLVLRYFEEPGGDQGDTLAKFIVLELGDTFDAVAPDTAQAAEAARAMRAAADQLSAVADALEDLVT